MFIVQFPPNGVISHGSASKSHVRRISGDPDVLVKSLILLPLGVVDLPNLLLKFWECNSVNWPVPDLLVENSRISMFGWIINVNSDTIYLIHSSLIKEME